MEIESILPQRHFNFNEVTLQYSAVPQGVQLQVPSPLPNEDFSCVLSQEHTHYPQFVLTEFSMFFSVA